MASSRKESKQLGAARYFTGRLCPQGHAAERFTSNGRCVECSYAANRAFMQHARDYNVTRCKRWRSDNEDKYRAWYKQNVSILRRNEHRRRARLAGTGGRYTDHQIADLFKKQRGKCMNCLCSLRHGFHVDHIQPLARGGNNLIGNIQLLCPTCNWRKNVKDPFDFARNEGRLL
jgi:5-methylcytosine-specific restriction endonuclease McrA